MVTPEDDGNFMVKVRVCSGLLQDLQVPFLSEHPPLSEP
ncbi:hypothetical protein EYF80_064411 [Liparis tanakae]|uniref:Uncharacterized protein n=1 Tax=Liparis tanakae TaxID=230148 RepID=A0A4Z2E9G4_9TELE|nr:hypothetical protein EYF80_064411 [Liparis tanakae]